MAFHIEQNFEIAAGADAVWRFLIDPHEVASCLPGAAITEQLDDNTYSGTMTVKVGPVSASYKGKITFEKLDHDAREAKIVTSGQDVRGKGGAKMDMVSRVTEVTPGRTQVTVVSDVNVTGILAQFGRGMIQDVSDRMLERFTVAMTEQLQEGELGKKGNVKSETGDGRGKKGKGKREKGEANGGGGELDIVALGVAAGRRALGRMLRNPVLWIALAVVAILAYWLFLR
ncbi:MAG: SRPBCC family protein [Gemmatimonadales bacterium]